MPDRLVFGSDENCDIEITDLGLASKHAVFSQKKGVLIVQNVGGRHATKVNRQKLEQGKSYILDNGDQITMGKITVKVVEVEYEDEVEEAVKEEEIPQHPQSNEHLTQSLSHIEPSDLEDEDEEDDEEDEVVEVVQESTSIDVGRLLQQGKSQYIEDESKPSHRGDSSTLVKITRTIKKLFSRKNKPKKETDAKGQALPRISQLAKKDQQQLKGKGTFGGISKEIPGVIIRLYGFIITLSIAWLLSLILSQTLGGHVHIQELHETLNLWIDQNLSPLHPLLEELKGFHGQVFLATFFIIEFASALLLGVPLGLWLLGVRETSDFLICRIKAIIRTPLGWLTGPFLLFDLGVLAKRRSLKEFVTFSTLEKRSPFMAVVTTILITPIIAILLALSPLIFYEGDHYQFSQRVTPIDREDLEPLRFYRMSSFRMDIPWSDYLDGLSVVHPSGQAQGGFGLEIWESREGGIIRITPEPLIDVRDWVRTFFQGNALASRFIPDLYDLSISSSEGRLNPYLEEQFIKMFRFAFLPNYTDPLDLYEAVLDYGPNLTAFLRWREFLIGTLNLRPDDQVEYWDLGQRTWLVITRIRESGHQLTLIPLNQMPSLPLRIETQGLPYQTLLRFLDNQVSFFTPLREDPRPIENELDLSMFWTAPNLANLMNHRFDSETDFPYDQRNLDYLHERLYLRLRAILMNNTSNAYQRRLDERLQQISSIFQRDYERLTPKVKAFSKRFIEVQKAYQSRDLNYFEEDIVQ